MKKVILLAYLGASIFSVCAYIYWLIIPTVYSTSFLFLFLASAVSALVVIITPFVLWYLYKNKKLKALKFAGACFVFHFIFLMYSGYVLIEAGDQIEEHFNEHLTKNIGRDDLPTTTVLGVNH